MLRLKIVFSSTKVELLEVRVAEARGAPRARLSDRSFGDLRVDSYLARRSGTVAPADARRSAAADLPGLRPFRRGSWILAQT